MTAIRTLLIIFALLIAGYTAFTIARHGGNFIAVAFYALMSFAWLGQFTLDYGMYLTLSAIWIIWRDRASSRAVVMAVLCGVLGMLIFAPYLIWLLSKSDGDVRRFLLGVRAETG